MSLRYKLLSVVAAFSVLMIAVSLFVAFDAWTTRQNIQYVAVETTKSDRYLDASRAYLNERDGVSLALATSEKIDAAGLAELGRTADQKGTSLVATLKSAGSPEVAEEIAGDIKELAELRELTRPQFSVEIDDRDRRILKKLSKSMTHLVEEFEVQRRKGSRGPSALNPVAGQYSEIKHTALLARDLIGLESLLFAGLIRNELPLSPKSLRIIADYRGRFETLWSGLVHNTEIVKMPGLSNAVSTARENIEKNYNAMRELVIKQAIAGDEYTIKVEKWNEVSRSSIESLEAVIEVATNMGNKHLADKVAESTVELSISAAVILVSLVLMIGSYYVVTSGVMNPLNRMTGAMLKLADGDTSVEFQGEDRKDEIGEMARTVTIFRQSAIERERLQADQQEGDAAREERQQKIETLINGFRTEVQDLLASVGSNMDEMKKTAGFLNGVAEDTSTQASDAASASLSASNNVQTVAAATEELSASVSEISQQIGKTTQVVGAATDATRQTNDQISGLANAVQKIGEVVALIQGIAEQTNLLALNATIEAARAGDMGKGFAVVASEVKALANQTAQATEEISQQVSMIQSSTGEAVQAVQGIVSTMEEVNGFTASIAAAVEEQGAATSDISSNVQQAAQGTKEVSESMSNVSSAVSETTQSAAQMQQSATDVGKQAEHLQSTVDTFLTKVAAA